MTAPSDVCTTCHALIYWASTDTGKAMPIDAPATLPDPAANLWAWRGTHDLRVSANPPPAGSADVVHRVTSHFATCSDPDAHRKRVTKKPPPEPPP